MTLSLLGLRSWTQIALTLNKRTWHDYAKLKIGARLQDPIVG